jgi:hypothetical protein
MLTFFLGKFDNKFGLDLYGLGEGERLPLCSEFLATEINTRNLPLVKGCWRVRLTTLLSSVDRLSRERRSHYISQPYRPV